MISGTGTQTVGDEEFGIAEGDTVSFPVPDRPELAALAADAASRASALWAAHRGLG